MDDVGGAVLTHILDSKEPCCLEELMNIPGVRRKHSPETVKQTLVDLCSIGIIADLPGELFIAAEKKQAYLDQAGFRPSLTQTQSLPDRTDPYRGQVPTPVKYSSWTGPGPGANPTHSSVPTGHAPGARAPPPGLSQAIVQQNNRQGLTTVERSYDCDDQVQAVFGKLSSIMAVLQSAGGDSPIHATKIAQLSGLGQSKSSVNRELYELKERGFLTCDNANWSMVRVVSVEELRVCAANLAKKSPGRRAANQVARPGQPQGSQQHDNTDCSCPNRGAGCTHNHFHLHQIINNHQTNVQVGENNQLFFAADGERSRSSEDQAPEEKPCCINLDNIKTAELKQQLEDLKIRINKVLAENDLLKINKEHLLAQNDLLKTNKEFLLAENDLLKTNKEHLLAENELLKTNKEHLLAQNDLLKKNKEHLLAQNDLLKTNKEHLLAENDLLKTNKEHLLAENELLKTNKEHLLAENELLKTNKEHLLAENDLLKTNKEHLLAENDLLKTNKEHLLAENELLKTNKEHLLAENDLLKTNKEHLLAENELLKTNKEHLLAENDLLKTNKEHLLPENDLLKTNKEHLLPENDLLRPNPESKPVHSPVTDFSNHRLKIPPTILISTLAS